MEKYLLWQGQPVGLTESISTSKKIKHSGSKDTNFYSCDVLTEKNCYEDNFLFDWLFFITVGLASDAKNLMWEMSCVHDDLGQFFLVFLSKHNLYDTLNLLKPKNKVCSIVVII